MHHQLARICSQCLYGCCLLLTMDTRHSGWNKQQYRFSLPISNIGACCSTAHLATKLGSFTFISLNLERYVPSSYPCSSRCELRWRLYQYDEWLQMFDWMFLWSIYWKLVRGWSQKLRCFFRRIWLRLWIWFLRARVRSCTPKNVRFGCLNNSFWLHLRRTVSESHKWY